MRQALLRGARAAAAVFAALALLFLAWLGWAFATYPSEYVWRVLLWQDSDVGDYLEHFPRRELRASSRPFHFELALDEERVADEFESILGVPDLDAFLARTQSQALIVIKDDRILMERYANGWQRDSTLTSFSVAKSFVSTLVGIAVDEGYIASIDDPVTKYLPELRERDERFERITVRHLLTMSSGLEYEEQRLLQFDGDDPLTTYYPDQRAISLGNTRVIRPPGEVFLYNKYHPQLLGLILERTTGMTVTEWTQRRLWEPLGMEFDGAWCLDSTSSGFEKLEAGLNARAIDYAKLGALFLHRGEWNGARVVSERWVTLATGADASARAPAFSEDVFYGFMWWGGRVGDPVPDFAAQGDHGQYVFASPSNRVIIVRNGVEFGTDGWLDVFYEVARRL